PPYRGATVLDVLREVREEEPARPRSLNPRIDRDLETIVLKCLEKAPSRRYSSAEALAEDLEAWLTGVPIRARPRMFPGRLIKWPRRRPALAALVVVACAAVTASGLAVRGLVALSKESARRYHAENELALSRDRKAQMVEERYFHEILLAASALASHDL